MNHRWDEIRTKPTTITTSFIREMGLDSIGNGIHESLLRSYHILDTVKVMIERGDSTETISEFISWAEQRQP